MQSFNTELDNTSTCPTSHRTLVVGAIDELPPGACVRFELPDGDELAIYNVNGEFYATGNFCPHKGAPLSEGALCGHIIECGLHGWQFDVRNGECLTVTEKIKTYTARVEEGKVTVTVE
jgi:nitrite reductase/ring-hydroxylating ferredoxin subunit